jgi:two-component system, response regulator PdtaR
MADPTRVLIVEDQYLVAHDSEYHLRSAGFDCVGLASSAEQAVALAEKARPDIVVMDIRLATARDGVAAALDIFQRFGIRSLFTSGHADEGTREQAVAAHPLGWLSKPYTPQALIAAVQSASEQVQSEGSANPLSVH